MPEAEDVLLEAAHHATARLRAVWERGGAGDAAAPRRRLETWQAAWLGRSWPVVASDPPAGPGLVSRALRRPAPWQARPPHLPTHDGQRIFVPRGWLVDPRPAAWVRTRVATLVCARRLWRGAASDGGPRVRELAWLAEGARAEAALVRAFPGLCDGVARLRREALASRPALARLRPAEAALERELRALLATPAGAVPRAFGTALAPDVAPATLAEAAARFLATQGDAGRCRGVAPVAHWGAPGPQEPDEAAPPAGASAGSPRRVARSAELSRPLARAPEPETSERPGAFVVAPDDGHQTVEAPGVARPTDLGEDVDPEVLAAEMARLDALPRVRDPGAVREVIEGGAAARSAPSAARIGPSGDAVFLYPEWDAGREGYRDPGCRVREAAAGARDPRRAERILAEHRDLRRRLRRQLETLRPRRERRRRQREGDDLDPAGWVSDWSDRRAGLAPSGHIYTSERRIRRDVAVSLLLDASHSTERPLDGRRCVIDVVRETALVFGEALASLGDRRAVLAFSSRGAGDVRVQRLAGFGEAFDAAARAGIAGLEPDGFTRLGAALRHATAGLARVPARARLLLLLSDARPQDEDGYEGTYGLEDVRQAVAEARQAGVRVFAVVVDDGPGGSPERVFGPGGYTRIADARVLPDRLPAIYRRLTAGT